MFHNYLILGCAEAMKVFIATSCRSFQQSRATEEKKQTWCFIVEFWTENIQSSSISY
jgi:hypothetical protein